MSQMANHRPQRSAPERDLQREIAESRRLEAQGWREQPLGPLSAAWLRQRRRSRMSPVALARRRLAGLELALAAADRQAEALAARHIRELLEGRRPC